MNRVVDRLWIGSTEDLDGSVPLRALGFVAVLDLRDGRVFAESGVDVLHLDNRDGDPWSAAEVGTAMQFLFDRIRLGRVLVACAAGKSRSASMVLGFLVRCGWDFPSAFAHLKAARPEIAPVQKMLESVLGVVS